MATSGDEMAPSESSRAREKSRTSSGKSDQGGTSGSWISKLEEMLKQVTVPMSALSINTILHGSLCSSHYRSKIPHPTTMEDLPDEILTNIFIRLLARQLGQMRAVSKSWNAFLSHPSFVHSHLHHSIRNNNQQILLVLPNCYQLFKQISCKAIHLEPVNFIKHASINLPMKVIGSVNGLICISTQDSYSNIHVWNPSLSAMSAIPPSHSLSALSTIPSQHPYISTSMRFGFDPKTDDYKLVKIEGVRNCIDFSANKWQKVEVYSMRKGCWKFITQLFPSHIKRIYNSDYVCVDGHNGHLHWEAKTGLWTSSTIVGFDLGSETFREIPLPDSILDSNHGLHRLGILDGKLCEMSWLKDGGWEVWVMEEYGVPESWVIRHVLSSFQFDEGVYLYGFTSHNKLLLERKNGRLVLYDPIANKTKFTRKKQRAIKTVEYVDSLVWI